MKYLVALIFGLSGLTAQGLDMGGCGGLIEEQFGWSNNTDNDLPIKIEGGKIVITNANAVEIKDEPENGTSAKYVYKVDLGDGQFDTRTLTITKGQKDGTYHYDLSHKESPFFPQFQANQAIFGLKDGECRLEQTATRIKYSKDAKPVIQVYEDAAYCDKINEMAKKYKDEDLTKCTKILLDADREFNNRADELLKEGKFFRSAGQKNEFYAAYEKIAMCSPSELKLRQEYSAYTSLSRKKRNEHRQAFKKAIRPTGVQ
jgi:hypothetical protein